MPEESRRESDVDGQASRRRVAAVRDALARGVPLDEIERRLDYLEAIGSELAASGDEDDSEEVASED
jgi:hypothetical protein